MHLEERAKNPVRTYSNGIKQRLMIGPDLLYDPLVLFLDEPKHELDPNVSCAVPPRLSS